MGRPRLCKCGCHRKVSPGHFYIKGHHRRGVNLSEATKEAISAGRRKSIRGDIVV